jgi:hypothetical protein
MASDNLQHLDHPIETIGQVIVMLKSPAKSGRLEASAGRF